MTPPNRGKRPSARPARRPASAHTPAPQGDKAASAKEAPAVAAAAKSADAAKAGRPAEAKARANRVSARRVAKAEAPDSPQTSAKSKREGGRTAGAQSATGPTRARRVKRKGAPAKAPASKVDKSGAPTKGRAAASASPAKKGAASDFEAPKAAEPIKEPMAAPAAKEPEGQPAAGSEPTAPVTPPSATASPAAPPVATPTPVPDKEVTARERPSAAPARTPAVVVPLPTPAASVPPPGDPVPDAEEIWTAGAPPVLPDLDAETEGAQDTSEGPVSRLLASDRRIEEADSTGARAILDSDYFVRQYGARSPRSAGTDVDEFGLDPHAEERARPYLEALCKHYFRAQMDGASHVPAEGPVMLVANRSGALPWDGLVLRTALRMARPDLSPLRWLSEDSVIHYPFLGVFLNRVGAVRGCPENAERLLEQRRLIAVFPEGAQGSGKLFRDRYRLQRFGRGGYVRLALKHGAPIVPTAIVGAEETNPVLGRSRFLGRALGADFLPLTPTFPWLGPVGLLPAPVKWRFVVGQPLDLSGYGPEAADDALVVHRLNEQVRSMLQSLIEQATRSRRSVLFG